MNQYMLEAINEAKKAYKLDEVPVGAIIVKDGLIVGRGYNLRESKHQSINHAEIIAIQEACKTLKSWRLDGCTLYVTLEPCIMCAGAIMQSRIEKVVYGASDDKAGCIDSVLNLYEHQGFSHYPIHISGVMEKECSQLIKQFFKEKRSQK